MEKDSSYEKTETFPNKIYGNNYTRLHNPATLSALPIDIYTRDVKGDEILMGCATAFCDRWNGKLFLITNWHNVTGRDPANGQPKEKDGVVPSFVRAHFLKNRSIKGEPSSFSPVVTVPMDLPIATGQPTKWIMHESGQEIDVAATEITLDEHIITLMSDVVSIFDPVIEIGSELFVLGFPRGLKPIGNLPIWKRASIASEPRWMAWGERCFWIDTATREGMSGSPVIARTISAKDQARLITHAPISVDTLFVAPPGLAFMGIYSGRVGVKDALEAQIGKVWHAATIQEMLNNPRGLDYVIK